AWNFFDEGLANGKDFPVLRLPKSAPLTRGPVKPLPEERTLNKPINFDVMFRNPPNFAGNPVGAITWLDDGEHFLQVKDNRLWKVHALTGRAKPAIDSENLKKSLDTVPNLKREEAGRIAGGPAYRLNPPRTAVLFTHGDELYYAKLDGSPAVRLTKA